MLLDLIKYIFNVHMFYNGNNTAWEEIKTKYILSPALLTYTNVKCFELIKKTKSLSAE